jgi:hypothetical protein
LHVVLVPGFAGFDALGQLEYYAGVTPQFRRWQAGHGRTPAVLHYFDNFPTAAVKTRAARLQSYLAKRIARGEFQRDDRVALVGHSTGGLDIRRFVWDLADGHDKPILVDGGKKSAVTVKAGEILDSIHRIVFLSVPQWGTDIADWVRSYALGRSVVIAKLRASVAASQLPLLDRLEEWLGSSAAHFTGVNLLLALQDALREADASAGRRSPIRTASAQEAASQLGLWLRHMASDFGAINDLAAQAPRGEPASPAHFTPATRRREMARWEAHNLKTRSYATLGKPPFRFDPGRAAPRWDLLKPWTYPECAKDNELSTGTDIIYRLCYRACAGGPFNRPTPDDHQAFQCLSAAEQRQIEGWHNDGRIELWDNDGIVNTASMFWPDGERTLLVAGDHMDIVGHYGLMKAIPGCGREYQAYDLLKSDSGFGDDTFERVWNHVFDFCAS